MEIKEIVMKLIGDVQPVGKTETDLQRLDNLKRLCNLVNELVYEIDKVHTNSIGRSEYSVCEMADYADKFLTETLGITNN